MLMTINTEHALFISLPIACTSAWNSHLCEKDKVIIAYSFKYKGIYPHSEINPLSGIYVLKYTC
jgi:hypothetical protein